MPRHEPGKIRLQKFLSEAGVAARRAAEDLVIEGRVVINDRVVDGLPAFVDPLSDDVYVDGQRVRPAAKSYYLLNKPRGTVVSTFDPAGRKKVGDLMAGVQERVFPVGRLEVDADGVLLMTNDGDLAEKLTHPRYGVEKVYRVEVRGLVSKENLLKIRKGMWFAEGRTPPARIDVTFSSRELTIMEMTIRESKHRAIPRMLARLGYKVKKFTCIRIGRLTTKGLQPGQYRPLTAGEVKQLHKLAEKVTADAKAAPPGEGAERARRPGRATGGGRAGSGRSSGAGRREREGAAGESKSSRPARKGASRSPKGTSRRPGS